MQATVARKPNHRGEHEVSRNPTAQGGRLTRLNLWRLARALKRCRVPGRLKRANGPGRFTAFGAAGAAGTRSPCALFIEEGANEKQNSDKSCRENEDLRPSSLSAFFWRECRRRHARERGRCERRKGSPRYAV